MSLDLIIMALGGDTISIADRTASSLTTSPTTATATYRLETDGDIGASAGNNTVVDVGDWVSPKGGASDAYEARATIVSGSLTSGTTGTWQGLGTQRTWTLNQPSAGTGPATCVFTLEIRRASDSVVLDTATITLSAETVIP